MTFQRGIGGDSEPVCLCGSMIKGKLKSQWMVLPGQYVIKWKSLQRQGLRDNFDYLLNLAKDMSEDFNTSCDSA